MTPSAIQVLIRGEVPQQLSLLELAVTYELNRHASLLSRFRQLPGSRHMVEDDFGAPVEVVARDENGTSLTLFRGLVRRVDVEHELSGAGNLIYHGVSETWLDDVTTRSRIFRKKTVDAILRELAIHSKPRRVEASGGPYTVVQYAESDWSLMVRLADRHRCFIRVSPDGADIISAYEPPAADLTWRKEKSLAVFRSTGRLVPVHVNGPNYDRATAVSRHFQKTSSEPPQLGSLGSLIGAAVRASLEKQLEDGHYGKFLSGTHDRFEDELRLESERRRLRSCNGYGESQDCRVSAGACVSIAGLDEAEGTYGVYRVEHIWTLGKGYRNRFWCSPFSNYLEPVQPGATQGSWRKPPSQASLPSSPVRIPHIRIPSPGGGKPREPNLGMTIGRVVASAVAEAGARVRVKFLWEDQESETTWAPVLSPHAGGKRGLFFMPEVGDEVAILFEQGDPSRPIVLGSLWNGTHTPPNDDLHGGEADSNDIKRIVTKSGNRLVFDDLQGDEAIVLATPQHIRISMFEGDQTLLIHSDGDILLHAGGTIHMRCNQFLREIGPSGESTTREGSPLLSPFMPFPPESTPKTAATGEGSPLLSPFMPFPPESAPKTAATGEGSPLLSPFMPFPPESTPKTAATGQDAPVISPFLPFPPLASAPPANEQKKDEDPSSGEDSNGTLQV